jgi:hypothetical protein
MRGALSAMAYAGSPLYSTPGCTGKTYAKNGPDPAVSCHFDLTQGNFKAQAVADAIGQIRGKVLGCTYELPRPDGGTIDKDYVNVSITVNGNSRDLFRRKDPQNPCVNNGCWDWVGDKIQLIGSACNDVQNAMNAKVKITVGCQTVIG